MKNKFTIPTSCENSIQEKITFFAQPKIYQNLLNQLHQDLNHIDQSKIATMKKVLKQLIQISTLHLLMYLE